jgi:fumarate hydratase subunit beta
MISIRLPLTNKDTERLTAGDKVLISGVIYAARDAAHKKFIDLLDRDEKLPFDIKNQIIYYTGPTPARPGKIIGSAGPTTSTRMDIFTPRLLELGLKGMIGKGDRSETVKEAIKRYKAIYFIAVGGAGALIAKTIKKAEVIAFPELGPEAVMRFEVENFPAIVAISCRGKDIFDHL